MFHGTHFLAEICVGTQYTRVRNFVVTHARKCERSDPRVNFYSTPSRIRIVKSLNLDMQVADWYSGTSTDYNAGSLSSNPAPMLVIVGSMLGLAKIIFLINLWCSFCLPLYIFYAEEFEPLFFIPSLELTEIINDKAVEPSNKLKINN